MYAPAAAFGEYPYGPATPLVDADLVAVQQALDAHTPIPFPCIVEVELEFPWYTTHVPIGYRLPDGRACWDTRRRRWCYTSIDLNMAVLCGAHVWALHGGYRWAATAPLFHDYLLCTMRGKEAAKAAGKGALCALYKLLGNTVFGYLLKHWFNNDWQFIQSVEDMDRFQAAYHLTCNVPLDPLGGTMADGIMLWRGERRSLPERLSIPAYPGAFLLSYSKWMELQFMEAVNPWSHEPTLRNLEATSYYGDTDSNMIHSSALPRIERWLRKRGRTTEGFALTGSVADESNAAFDADRGNWRRIRRYCALAPKLYGCVYDDETGVGHKKFRAKGFIAAHPVSLMNAKQLVREYPTGLCYDVVEAVVTGAATHFVSHTHTIRRVALPRDSKRRRETQLRPRPWSLVDRSGDKAYHPGSWASRVLVGGHWFLYRDQAIGWTGVLTGAVPDPFGPLLALQTDPILERLSQECKDEAERLAKDEVLTETQVLVDLAAWSPLADWQVPLDVLSDGVQAHAGWMMSVDS